MLLVEQNHAGASTSMHIDNMMLYLVVMAVKAVWRAMELAKKNRPRGTKMVPIKVSDPPQAREVMAAPVLVRKGCNRL